MEEVNRFIDRAHKRCNSLGVIDKWLNCGCLLARLMKDPIAYRLLVDELLAIPPYIHDIRGGILNSAREAEDPIAYRRTMSGLLMFAHHIPDVSVRGAESDCM